MVAVQSIDTTKPKTGRLKYLLLLIASKENTRVLSQSSASPNNKTVEVLSKGYMHTHEGASAEENSA